MSSTIPNNFDEQVAQKTVTDAEIAALFPRDFLWGAATAAYQIEGATSEDGRGPSIWDYFARIPGKVFNGDTGDIAANHYHRMPEDVALIAELGLKSYRFSIAWPRVIPEGRGSVNAAGLDFYERLVDTLLAHNITPLVTLYHWDLPLALHERGGWLSRDTAYAFADYAEVVARRLGDRIDSWVTHNEPWCNAFLGYGTGFHAPGLQDMPSAFIAGHHMLLGHGLAIPRLRSLTREGAQLGITLNLSPVYGVTDDPALRQSIESKDTLQNRWFLDPLFKGHYPEQLYTILGAQPQPLERDDLALISVPLDFLGINYYSRALLRASDQPGQSYEEVTAVAGSQYTAMGWEVYPNGLTDLLLRLQQDYAPRNILITENGAAFSDEWDGGPSVVDSQRLQYLREHIHAVGRARAQGVPVQGYYVWSLLDNYEWTEGYSKRFGIVYVDYASQRRIVKESGRWYAQFLKL